MTYEMMEKKAKKQKKELIKLLKRKKKAYWKRKMIIYYLSVRNCKKLTEKLNCKTFYHNTGNKKKILKKFVNGKQQIIIVTSVFGMKIDIVDIKIIVYTNELKMMLDYTQENK